MNTKALSEMNARIKNILIKNRSQIGRVIDFDFGKEKFYIFDLTKENQGLSKLNLHDQNEFSDYIESALKNNHCRVGIGRYDEDRIIYQRSKLFSNNEDARSLHLGIDIWATEGEKVFAPLEATVHSYKDNDNFGDYGPTIILEHVLEDVKFYTLYGHLSRESLLNLSVGKKFLKGEQIATIGDYSVNGNWPAHVHFEIIVDVGEKVGDFPGVAKPSEREYYLTLCPNPNLILKIDGLL